MCLVRKDFPEPPFPVIYRFAPDTKEANTFLCSSFNAEELREPGRDALDFFIIKTFCLRYKDTNIKLRTQIYIVNYIKLCTSI